MNSIQRNTPVGKSFSADASENEPFSNESLTIRSHLPRRGFLATLVMFSVSGALANPSQGHAADAQSRDRTLANVASLLHQLLEKQKHLKKLLLIKKESDPLQKLVEDIAAASKLASSRLEEMARQDPPFSLKEISLPSGETATREAIERTRTRDLLKKAGRGFELELLLSQSEALTYAWHLAQVAAASDTNPARARTFGQMSQQMQNLRQEVFSLIHSGSRFQE